MKQSQRLILAFILAIMSVFIVRFYINSKLKEIKKTRITVFVAKRDIEAGTIIDRNMVEEKAVDLPAGLDYIDKRKIGDIVGKTAVSFIRSGTIIPVHSIGGFITVPRFSDKISRPSDNNVWRSITLPVDEVTGNAGFIQPGDRVDIIITAQRPQSLEIKSWTLLENVKVLAIGNILEPTYGFFANRYGTITIEVTKEEAEIITFIRDAANGRFTFVLRNPEDIKIIGKSSQGIKFTDLWMDAENLSLKRRR